MAVEEEEAEEVALPEEGPIIAVEKEEEEEEEEEEEPAEAPTKAKLRSPRRRIFWT